MVQMYYRCIDVAMVHVHVCVCVHLYRCQSGTWSKLSAPWGNLSGGEIYKALEGCF